MQSNSETGTNENDKEILKERLNSSLYDYSDAYILVKGTMSITAQAGGKLNNGDKEVLFKNFRSFTDCISEINNAQVDTASNNDPVLPMYNLIEYGDNYSKISRRFWQY